MRGTVLVCGDAANPPGVHDAVRVPTRPGKKDVDDVLPDAERVVVVGDDADLAAVVLRLVRRELLSSVAVGFVPAAKSQVARLYGLPTEPAAALRLAQHGEPQPVTLLRDDNGGVLLGLGVLEGVNGVGYCDDQLTLRGPARRVEVRPHAEGVAVRVDRGALRRRTAAVHGRAFQYGGSGPVQPVLDGVPRQRRLPRWTWYRHTEDLLLVRG